ncbi:MAG: hypothetical protein IMZ57_06900 [Acidobacteria bacterium]|nr:hypothetical protein [Acidobacteriota bacterium]
MMTREQVERHLELWLANFSDLDFNDEVLCREILRLMDRVAELELQVENRVAYFDTAPEVKGGDL